MRLTALLRTWTFDPAVIVPIAVMACGYARGIGRLWARAGSGRGVRPGQVMAFVGGLLALVLALISPLDTLDTALFSAHMAQHLVLILVAAPLLVLGAPHVPFLWALPPAWCRAIGRRWKRSRVARPTWHVLSHPVTLWLLNVAILWGWHMPILYEAALGNDAVHALEHGCLLGVSALFWWTLLQRAGRRLPRGLDVLYVFTTGVQMSILGALITFASAPWYPAQEVQAAIWRLTPLEDQQLAGLIMWIPASVVYLLASALLFVAWLRAEEAAMQRRERAARDVWQSGGSGMLHAARPAAEHTLTTRGADAQ